MSKQTLQKFLVVKRRHGRQDKSAMDRFYRALRESDFDGAVEINRIELVLPDYFVKSALRPDGWKPAPTPQERRIAIAQFYGVSPSWVRLEGEVVNHQTAAKPRGGVLARLRVTAKVALHTVAGLLLQAAGR